MIRFLSSFLFAGLLFAGCKHQNHEEAMGKLPVTNGVVKSIVVTRDYVAQIRAIQHIELRGLEQGYLEGVFVDEGQLVQRGTKLFQIMPLVYQAEVQKAEAETERADIEYGNTKSLAEKNVVSPNELALAKANLSRAKAQLGLAATHRKLTEIHAPFTGIVGRFQARLGSLLNEGDLLTTLSDNRTMWVYFNVAEAEYLKYKSAPAEDKARKVKLILANGELFSQPGVVETIEADFDNETGTIAFRATFPNPDGLLRHGQTGKVQLSVPLENALVIPQKATFDVLNKKFVFVVDDQRVVHSREITVSVEQPQVFVVTSGLSEKDKILLDGLRKVRDGSVIEPEYKTPADVLAHLETVAE